MPHVPGWRSCYAKVGRLVYFGRMLDKIRLHAAGQLPPEYQKNLGETQGALLDVSSRFLGVRYADVRDRVLAGDIHEAVLAWAHAHGTPRSDEDCHMWNRFFVEVRMARSAFGSIAATNSRRGPQRETDRDDYRSHRI